MLCQRLSKFIILLATIVCAKINGIGASNILVVLPSFSPSHLVIQMAVARVMSERNHNVTVVSSLPLKSEWMHPSMTHIKLDAGVTDMNAAIAATRATGLKRLFKSFVVMDIVIRSMGEMLDDPNMQELMINPGNQFDLMLFGYVYADFFFGLAERFNVPVAMVWPNIPVAPVMQIIGNPMGMSYGRLSLLNAMTSVGNTGFLFRVKNLFAAIMELTMVHVNYWTVKDIYSKHFHDYAPLEKAKERASMVLFSHHFSEKPARPLIPAMIEVGGIHLNEQPNPLPKDIETFINSAEHGVILFSMGTNTRADHLQPKALEKIYNVFSQLPQKVIWKCDDESNVPGNATNILFRNWLPQSDILGHPNVKLFFGHGGKGGITEAKFYGVPIVGLPIFADQPMNMEEIVAKGYGLSLDHNELLTEDIIYRSVKEVLHNESYTNNVKQFSKLYRDRPLKVKDNVAYWLEYLLRYKGAPHLQSPLKTMSFVEANNLDIFLILGLILYLLMRILKIFIKLLFRVLCGKNQQKTKQEIYIKKKKMVCHRNGVSAILCAGIIFLASSAHGANILAFLPSASPSHLIIQMAVVKAMAVYNHNVTVISVLPLKSEWLHPSMTYIRLDKGLFDMNGAVNATQKSGISHIMDFWYLLKNITVSLAETLDDPKMLELRNNRGNKFDLMLYGYMFGDYFTGLAEHFDCPMALLWPNIPVTPIMKLIGNPFEISYNIISMLNLSPNGNGFAFRFKNILFMIGDLFTMLIQNYLSKSVYEKHFPADKYASYEKAKERVAMVLFSHHFSEKPVRPLVPGLIEIGGIHLNEVPNLLPKDIDDFINSAEHGVIFFSLGTNVKNSHLQPQALEKIYNVLSKLPQKVLWKCDDESQVPGNSPNILYRKWLPQADILGHPNVKLFFGHGGKGGITEAKFYGVPMVGLPIFGDQPMNMDEVVRKGYGLSIDHDETLTEEVIRKTVKEVLENETYRNNVKEFSSIYRDRPLKIKDNAVYWLEYLIRYKGAPHLQSPLKTMSFVEANNLDVFACIFLIFYVVMKILKISLKLIFRFLCGKNSGKMKKE
ncbi:uncharacterized protein LOC142234749 [Haematobia irritans]|uniref:uncharacterized protein LOC142234749 n=1 Tax=Haematobia irritans TaxID=7368 RepID=UPI003F50C48B